MGTEFKKRQIALAVVGTISTAASVPTVALAGKVSGQYVSGDFHNHTTCSDGSISMRKLVGKATDKSDGTFGLDWFVQAGHGGNGNRNCTLVEDASLSTPAYPYIEGYGPNTTWQGTPAEAGGPINPQGDVSGSAPNQNMWRWQAIQQYQYPLQEYLNAYLDRPLFLGVESVVAGHEHTSMSVITGQMPVEINDVALPTSAGYKPLGNANGLAQWLYCFDRGNSDTSRGAANQWECSVPGSPNSASTDWNAAAAKLNGAMGDLGHAKTLEGLKWMNAYHPGASYYVPAHLERPGPFNPKGNNGYNIEHLRDFNNVAPKVAFGFETQPGHGASSDRGEYYPNRNNFGNGVVLDSVGGTTWGGTGIYGAKIGGVWDALLGEGRAWWFFASSDWHNRGSFGPDDRRSTQDFYPGEYQRDFVMVRHDSKQGHWHQRGNDKLTPQEIVDGLRSGNSFATTGQLIDRMAFIACPSYVSGAQKKPLQIAVQNLVVKTLALTAAKNNANIDLGKCVTMGEKLVVRPGADIVVAVAVRDPEGTNYSPYSFNNPSLAQIGTEQPLNKPVLDHVDVIRGMVTSQPKKPGDADYAGEWPRTWLTNPDLNTVPGAAKNTTAELYKTFNELTWSTDQGDHQFKMMVFRIPAVQNSQYVRLRGTNLPPGVPYETDANGSPLADVYTNAGDNNRAVAPLAIPCTAVGSNVPANGDSWPQSKGTIDGCPNHLPVVNNQKMVAYDVAAWSDLWFYSNPIFVEVQGSTVVAGVAADHAKAQNVGAMTAGNIDKHQVMANR
jgi:hypothetical protein